MQASAETALGNKPKLCQCTGLLCASEECQEGRYNEELEHSDNPKL